jgi:acetyl-CoA acetyltransferase
MEAYIIDGVRTPIGSYQGTLASVRPDDLGALVIKSVVEKKCSSYVVIVSRIALHRSG